MTTAPCVATIDDRPDPISRALLIAETIDVDVSDVDMPLEDAQPGALYFAAVDETGRYQDCILVANNLSDDEKAAQIFFLVAIITADRDVTPGLASSLACHEPGAGGEFIAVSRNRLPEPSQPGYARLAHMMGKSAGLTEPAVFEVLR